MIEIAVIGDIHTHFNLRDVDYFNRSNYDLILFVGDLAHYRHRDGVKMSQLIAQLEKKVVLIPGNHDAIHAFHLLAEVKKYDAASRVFAWGHLRRIRDLQNALREVQVGGYSNHPFSVNGFDLEVIVGRPFAMGGSQFSYAATLKRLYNVPDMIASAARLKGCVDAAESSRLIFLAHNGPAGLGSAVDDIWGCDFRKTAGDFGDVDLHEAITYARQMGKQVLAVVAGHMHHALKGGGTRTWHVAADGIHYVNAARVPRIFMENGRFHHHHIRLSLSDGGATVQPCQIPL